MKVQPVFYNTSNTNYNISKQRSINTLKTSRPDSFSQTAFKGYNESLYLAAKSRLVTDREVEQSFVRVFKDLVCDNKVLKKPEFNKFWDIYDESGFRGLLNRFWKASSDPDIERFIGRDFEEPIILAVENEQPVFEIYNMGRHGFFNTLVGNKNASRDIRLSFSNPENSVMIDFSLGKKGELNLYQKADDYLIYSGYHLSTGKRSVETIHPKDGNPETTYYNKDGSKAFFKNWFIGGSANPAMW